jgi:extracellular elastinolytic metalloproteinase
MRMYLWNQVRPMKDGDLDSGIVIHEYAHSLSNRLTGGPSATRCLSGGQSGGMGEGWGDFLATMWLQRENFTEGMAFPMGQFAADRGIRQFPYSADMTVNPNTFQDVGRAYRAVHAVGAVWCNTLMDVYWGMKDIWGFEEDIYNVASPAANIVLVQLVTDGMKTQPCTPNIVQARDAIMEADAIRYNGIHQCEMWKRFAKRGLGEFARTTGGGFGTTTEDFTVPARCL